MTANVESNGQHYIPSSAKITYYYPLHGLIWAIGSPSLPRLHISSAISTISVFFFFFFFFA